MDTPSTPGAAAPVSSPAATPSAAPAPASTPAAAPAAPAAAPGVAAPDTRSTEQVIADKLSNAFSKDGVGGEPNPNPTTEVPGDNGEVEVPAAPGDEGAASENGEGQAEPADPDAPFADFQLEDPSGFGTEALSAAVKADAALSAALDANPELKAAVFANARRAERAARYDEILGSPEEAGVVVAGHGAFTGISGLMADVKDGDRASVSAVIDAMVQQTVLRDEEGNPRTNPDGSAMTDGSVGRFFKNLFSGRLDFMAEQAAAKGDEEALAAIDTLMERAGLRTPSNANEEDMSDAMRAQKADLDRQSQELATQRQQQREADENASSVRVDSQTDSYLDTSLKNILDKATGLDKFSRTNVESSIRTALRTAARSSTVYRAERARIERLPLGPRREKDMVKLNTEFFNTHLPKISRTVLSEAGASVVKRGQERTATQAARVEAAQSESRGSLHPTSPAAPAMDTLAQVEKDLTASLGTRPTSQQMIAERIRRQQAATTR